MTHCPGCDYKSGSPPNYPSCPGLQCAACREKDADIYAYRGALGYPVPGDHSGRLSDGTYPMNGIALAKDAEIAKLTAERDALKRHYDAAGPEHNLLALLDWYHDLLALLEWYDDQRRQAQAELDVAYRNRLITISAGKRRPNGKKLEDST